MASDEYRLEIDLHDALHGLGDRLRTLDLDDDVEQRLGDRVIVTRDGEKLYVYTETSDAAVEAQRVVERRARPRTASRPRSAGGAGTRPSASGRTPTSRSRAPTTRRRTTTGATRSRKGLPHPLFVFIEGHEPEFMRDL